MKIDKKVVYSVMVGLAAFGAVLWGVKKLPSGNVVTDTIKKTAEAVSGN